MLKEHSSLVHANSSWNEMGVEATAHMARQDMTEHLLQRGAPCSLLTCIMMAFVPRVRTILKEDPNRIRERGPHDFPLMWYPLMAKEKKLELASLLLDAGIDVDQETKGFTALHRCARAGNLEFARFLIEKGANVNAVGRTFRGPKQTPLQAARAAKNKDMAKLLQDHGARG